VHLLTGAKVKLYLPLFAGPLLYKRVYVTSLISVCTLQESVHYSVISVCTLYNIDKCVHFVQESVHYNIVDIPTCENQIYTLLQTSICM